MMKFQILDTFTVEASPFLLLQTRYCFFFLKMPFLYIIMLQIALIITQSPKMSD